ncbi:hypothetical protein MRB53_027412 [Persea americana]|uniref:Uncharacterized protein n=1 Tax=Persea americana TaxID=3435 RepID=A0ACC2LKS7_PERAE|nr:hypothetical protein MRB53_027412 [Persea americana]
MLNEPCLGWQGPSPWAITDHHPASHYTTLDMNHHGRLPSPVFQTTLTPSLRLSQLSSINQHPTTIPSHTFLPYPSSHRDPPINSTPKPSSSSSSNSYLSIQPNSHQHPVLMLNPSPSMSTSPLASQFSNHHLLTKLQPLPCSGPGHPGPALPGPFNIPGRTGRSGPIDIPTFNPKLGNQ